MSNVSNANKVQDWGFLHFLNGLFRSDDSPNLLRGIIIAV